MSGGGLV